MEQKTIAINWRRFSEIVQKDPEWNMETLSSLLGKPKEYLNEREKENEGLLESEYNILKAVLRIADEDVQEIIRSTDFKDIEFRGAEEVADVLGSIRGLIEQMIFYSESEEEQSDIGASDLQESMQEKKPSSAMEGKEERTDEAPRDRQKQKEDKANKDIKRAKKLLDDMFKTLGREIEKDSFIEAAKMNNIRRPIATKAYKEYGCKVITKGAGAHRVINLVKSN